jgi:excisionase family DNA binding protein
LLPADPEIRGGPDRRSITVKQESLLTVKQLAARLGVCTATIYRLCDRGELPYVRVAQALRFVPIEVAEYMARRRRGPRT